jgi:hypothetical protein
MKSKKILYLDQNAWIYLSQEKYNQRGKYAPALQSITAAVESGDLIVPLSIANFDETTRTRRMDGGRERLAKFMFEISRGYTIMPYASIIKWEIYDAVLRRVGRKPLEINVIKKGISNLVGAKAGIHGNIPDSLKRKLEQVTDSPEALFFLLSQQKPRSNNGADDTLQKIVEIYERGRKDVQGIPEKYRYAIETYKIFRDSVIPGSAPLMMALGIKPEDLKLTNRKAVEEFLVEMPTLFSAFRMTFQLQLDKSRKIQLNDVYDEAALAIAIPYCDIAVADKFWVSIAKQCKLDKIYHTAILSNVNDVPSFIAA